VLQVSPDGIGNVLSLASVIPLPGPERRGGNVLTQRPVTGGGRPLSAMPNQTFPQLEMTPDVVTRDAGGNVVSPGESADPSSEVPAVSICIPLYMKQAYVAETIGTVLAQTFTNFELIVLENASPDDSKTVAAAIRDPRLRLFSNSKTVSGAENHARVISLARAPLVKVVAADDRLHPTILERQVEVMRDPDIAVVGCRQNMIDASGAVIYSGRSLRTPDLLGRQDRAALVRRMARHNGNPVGVWANFLFRKAAYDAIGGMPDVPFIAQDCATAVEMLRHGAFFGQTDVMVDFRIAGGSDSAKQGAQGIADQMRYIGDLRRYNDELLRPNDRLYGRLRLPLMRLRHQLIVDAAGRPDRRRTKLARIALEQSRWFDAWPRRRRTHA
jgi:glycosyltransferase involved in cell wall biosynthesis